MRRQGLNARIRTLDAESLRTISNSNIQVSQKLPCSQQVAASDRPFRIGILETTIQGRAKRSSLRQLAISRILAQSPYYQQHSTERMAVNYSAFLHLSQTYSTRVPLGSLIVFEWIIPPP